MFCRTATLQPVSNRLRPVAINAPGIADALAPATAGVLYYPGVIVGLLTGFEFLIRPHRAQLREALTTAFTTALSDGGFAV